MPDGVSLGTLTITKTIAPDGQLVVSYSRSPGTTLLDALAMCAFAAHAFAADELQRPAEES